MNAGELLVIALVAVIVFGPNKLPMLAKHLGTAIRQLHLLKQQLSDFWQQQVNEQQLRENQQKAEKVDSIYLEKKTEINPIDDK